MTKIRFVSIIALLLPISAVAAPQCDCTIYPFKPNPPCYSICAAKLSDEPEGVALAKVKNIDPGVYVAIRVLSQSKNRKDVDFSKITRKQDLERAAYASYQIEKKKHN